MERYYTVGEVAELLETSPGTIRNWGDSFDFFIDVQKNENNVRFYTKNTVEKFRLIQRMRQQGFSIEAIRQSLLDAKERSEKKKAEENRGDVVESDTNTQTTELVEERTNLPAIQDVEFPVSVQVEQLKEWADHFMNHFMERNIVEIQQIRESFLEQHNQFLNEQKEILEHQNKTLMERLDKQDKYIEKILNDRDQALMSTIRQMQENAQEDVQQKKGFFQRMLGK